MGSWSEDYIRIWRVGKYDMGERNGGRPAGEGAKTPCSTIGTFKGTMRGLNGMRHRAMHG